MITKPFNRPSARIDIREGFGDVIARGPLRAAEWIGDEAPDMVMEYYRECGLDEKIDKPRRYTLERLGMEEIVKDLWG